MYIVSGDIEDEDEVLAWLTDEDTLEIPGKIEEVNSKMLEKILEENDHIVVFFCKLHKYTYFIHLILSPLNIIIFKYIFKTKKMIKNLKRS